MAKLFHRFHPEHRQRFETSVLLRNLFVKWNKFFYINFGEKRTLHFSKCFLSSSPAVVENHSHNNLINRQEQKTHTSKFEAKTVLTAAACTMNNIGKAFDALYGASGGPLQFKWAKFIQHKFRTFVQQLLIIKLNEIILIN